MSLELENLRYLYQESELRTIMSFDIFLEYYNNFHVEGLNNEIS